MTALTLEEMMRDEALAPFLRRYREASLREVMAANHPRLLEVVKAIQPAAQAALSPTNTQADE